MSEMSRGRLVVVGGLGYVGLPLAVLAQEKGWAVTSQDIDQVKVESISQGVSPLKDDRLAADLKQYPIKATTDYSVVATADVIIITVPTPVTEKKEPDLSPLKSALTGIAPHLKPQQLLIIESTVNPGVMDEIVMPLLNESTKIASDIHLAYCPERINPGDPKWTVRNIPRVLGGYSPAGIKLAQDFYSSVLEAPIMIMNSAAEAEAVKIIENTFRDVNIAFVNEMAKSFDALNIDIVKVIEGAATKPFAFMPHYPGSGVGGHCISVDPYYMIDRGQHVGFDHKFLRLARQINDSMPQYTVDLLAKGLTAKSLDLATAKIALLGLAYKKDVADIRESPALELRHIISQSNSNLRVFDPFVPSQSTVKSLDAALKNTDAVVLATAHTEFKNQLTAENLKAAGVKVVIDGRNALDADAIASSGLYYHGIGRSR